MKHDHPVTRIISALFAIFMVAYIGVQIWRHFYQPVETVTAVFGEVEETISLDGIVVREEQLLYAGDTGAMEIVAEEGEKVGNGDLVAGIYASEEAIEVRREIDELNTRIKKLQTVASQGNALIDIDTVDRAIVETMASLLSYVENDQVENSAGAAESLKTRILSREYIKRDKTELQTTIDQLKTDLNELKKQDQTARKQVLANTAGFFSRETDGYESVYARSQLSELSLESYLKLNETGSVQPNDDNVIGKIVTDYVWSYATVVSAEDAARFQKGKTVTLKFEDASYPAVPAQISQVTVGDDGRALVVMDCSVYISRFTFPRKLRAEVVLKTYSGLRIPREALRVNENDQTGVYCRIDAQVKFKPVQTIYETDTYYLVDYDSTNTKGLLLYDEVVVSAKGLEDRKMIQ
ncbi:MAG: hypothetical protein IJC88_04335 [Oscillospiraceae bacterium]|nr:hypothetical protein [Oscillospiraceae bacterium]